MVALSLNFATEIEIMQLLNPSEVFDSYWATALQDSQFSENDSAWSEGREPETFEGEAALEYGAKYRATVESICAQAEPYLAGLNLNKFPRRQGESSLSEVFGSDLYLTAVGHGAGFWDGDWGHIGDKLTELAKALPGGSLAGHINGGYFFI